MAIACHRMSLYIFWQWVFTVATHLICCICLKRRKYETYFKQIVIIESINNNTKPYLKCTFKLIFMTKTVCLVINRRQQLELPYLQVIWCLLVTNKSSGIWLRTNLKSHSNLQTLSVASFTHRCCFASHFLIRRKEKWPYFLSSK